MKSEYQYLQINAVAGLLGNKKGSIIRIKCLKVSEKGKKTRYVPVEQYWRNRVKDSAVDQCAEFVNKPIPKVVEKTAVEAEQEEGKPGGKDAKRKSWSKK